MQGSFLELHKTLLTEEDCRMPYFYEHLKQHLESLEPKRTFNQLQFPSGIQSGTFSAWKKPKEDPLSRRPSDTDLEKLAQVEWLGLELDTLRAWKAIEEYGEEVFRKGIEIIEREGLRK